MKVGLLRLFLITLVLSNAMPLHADSSEVLPVGLQPLSKLLVNAKKSAPASILSLNHSIVSAQITGQIKAINVEAGDLVKKGQRLLNVDCRTYELSKKQALAAVKVARTQLNYSSKKFKRDKRLVSQGTISRETFERTEANKLTAAADLELSRASVDTANLAISRCGIDAPFSGQITKRLAQQGQLVTSGTALFQILQNDNFEVKANLSSDDVSKINNSLELMFVSGHVKAKALIRSVIATIDENTNTQEVRLSLPKNINVPAGLSGRIEWISKIKKIPAEYIVRRKNRLGILLAKDIVEGIGKAHFYPLNNAKEGQAVEVSLPNETMVITKNRFRVNDTQLIKATP